MNMADEPTVTAKKVRINSTTPIMVDVAERDSSAQKITSTYIKAISISGRTVTLTKGDGSTSTVTTQDTTYSTATQSANGLMSSSDKTKLDGISAGANKTTVDSALSSTSTNPVQNKVINSALSNKSDKSSTVSTITYDTTNKKITKTINGTTSDVVTFSTVATTGSYNDLTNKPAIPTIPSLSVSDSGSGNVVTGISVSGHAITQSKSSVVDTTGTITGSQVAVFNASNSKIIKSSGYTIATSVPSGAVFTDTKCTAVGNHYSPTKSTTKSASGGTSVDITGNATNVVTGIEMDAKGHVTGVVSSALKSTNTTYTVGNGKITVTQNGTTKGTFTTNQTGATTIALNDTTYSTATASSNGLMSSSDKSKLDGIYANATNVTYTNKVTDGSVIGTININGVANNIYSPINNLKSESHILYCWEE